MTRRTLYLSVLAYLRTALAALAVAVACSFGVSIHAQPPPDGNGVPQQPPPNVRGDSPALQIARVAAAARRLLPVLSDDFVNMIIPWAEQWATLLSGLIILGSLLRIGRESGHGGHLFWFFARYGICFALVASSPPALIQDGYEIGKEIAEGNKLVGNAGKSLLFEWYVDQRTSFNDSYKKIADGTFKVRVKGEDFPVAPMDDIGPFLGVTRDAVGTVKDINNNLKDSAWVMPRLFGWLGFSRSLMELADVWLIVLSSVLVMIFKLVSPFMVVLAIDQRLAQRTAYPFLWGAIVLTIVWPSVSYAIRGIAYFFGNVAMAFGDNDPYYQWIPATLHAIRNPFSQPTYVVMFAAFIMSIMALMLWVTPLVAYRITTGQVYELASTMTGWMGAIAGTALEGYMAKVGSSLSFEAAQKQAAGVFESDTGRAFGDLGANNLLTAARKGQATSQVLGSRAGQLSSLYAQQGFQIKSLNAGVTLQGAMTDAQVGLAKRNLGSEYNRAFSDIGISSVQEAKNIDAAALGEIISAGGIGITRGAGYPDPITGVVAGGISGAGGGIAGSIANGVGTGMQMLGATVRSDMQSAALLEATGKRYQNLNKYTEDMGLNQDIYGVDVKIAQTANGVEMVNATKEYTGRAAFGVNRGAQIQLDGIDRAAGMEVQANQSRYDANFDAAGALRSAAIEAAQLHAFEQVLTRTASALINNVKQNLDMRF